MQLGHQFQILNTLADGNEPLASKHNARERFTCCLSSGGLHQEIDILREQDMPESHCPIQ